MYELIAALYPICRSISGNGVRKTLGLLQDLIPLEVHEVPSGTRVFDWTIPQEWNIEDAYIKDSTGRRIVDFGASNLHVVNYSVPVKRTMSLGELRDHLHTLPEHPEWIPYRTSYYHENWGFCLSERQLSELTDREYEVCIDSSLTDGFLTYGECFIKGQSEEEVLISCHTCHPSLCNDNLSGIALAVELAKHLQSDKRRYSYRLLFIPGTIGSITWLARNESRLDRIKHGFVLTCVGDKGPATYKKSRRGDAEIDRAFKYVLRHSSLESGILEFCPYGYDERQFCSPGFNLPVGCFMRSQHGTFPEYHTSADNLDFVEPTALADSLELCVSVIDILENNRTFLNQNPKCEPQLGRRGLYRNLAGQAAVKLNELALLWVLNLSDGSHSLLDISERSEMEFSVIKWASNALTECGLLRELSSQ
jgi:aminopeptidase-like protein